MRRRIPSVLSLPMPILAIVLVIVAILPPYVERGFDVLRIPELTAFTLTHSIRPEASDLFPAANLLGIVAFVAVVIAGTKAARPFSAYVTIAYFACAFLQNVSRSEQHGLAVSTSTMLLTLLVASVWLKVAASPGKLLYNRPSPSRAMLLVPIALVAIWHPISLTTMLPEFAPQGILASGSFLTFCMTTTVALSVLLMYYPQVDLAALQITSAAGLLIGIGNLWLEWIHLPALAWVGVLHVPLVTLSGLGLYLSARSVRTAAAQQLAEADPAGDAFGAA